MCKRNKNPRNYKQMRKKNSKIKNKSIEIFATIGPSTISPKMLNLLNNRGVNYIRLNLSHTPLAQVEPTLVRMLRSGIEVVIDTEGSQVRTGDLGKLLILKV